MSAFYEAIGRTVVTVIRVRFRRQLRIAGAVAIVGTAIIGYLLATRDVEEG